MNAKQLHKHALPVLVFGLGLGLVSASLLSHFMLVSPTGNAFIHALTERQFSIKPAANGLFHINHIQLNDQAAGNALLDTSSDGSGLNLINTAGQSASLDATLATPAQH